MASARILVDDVGNDAEDEKANSPGPDAIRDISEYL